MATAKKPHYEKVDMPVFSNEDLAKASYIVERMMTMPNNAKPDIHFRIPKEDYIYIQGVAKSLDRSAAYLIADIVTKWVQESRKARPQE